MFHRSVRTGLICTVLGCVGLAGCSTTPQSQHASLPDVHAMQPPATPRVNTAIASRLARNVLISDATAIQLGAGDRFGRQMHASYVASVRLQEHHRMLAEVAAGADY